MWNLILSFLGGPIISGALDAYKAKLGNENNEATLKEQLAEANVRADIARQTAEQAVLVAEQGNWLTRSVRPLFAAPFIIFLWKVIVWDKVLGYGVTDDLGPQLWSVATFILSAYFIGKSGEIIAAKLKAK